MTPGLIDGHLHLESSLIAPSQFPRYAVGRGTTAFVVDPHESANVRGAQGIDYILAQTENVPADVHVMMPSCVPAAPFERNGCAFDSEDMKAYLSHPRVLGLGEVMDCPAVLSFDEEMERKLALFRGRPIDGHAPGLTPEDLNAYRIAGVLSDHECDAFSYALLERQRGMHVLIREGSTARNLEAIVTGILRSGVPTEGFSFCTDDKHIADVLREGHIDHCVRKSIALGLAPEKAIKMASWNTARHYGLSDIGALAPGYRANLLVLDDVTDFSLREVYYRGELLTHNFEHEVSSAPQELLHTVNLGEFSEASLRFGVGTDGNDAIRVLPGLITNQKLRVRLPQREGFFVPDETYNKVAVVERHHGTGKCGVGAVVGFCLRGGAVATSVSHDSHNLIVIGDNDRDMVQAVREVAGMQGGYASVSGEERLCLPLPVMGLMSEAPYGEVEQKLEAMKRAIYAHGVSQEIDPFFMLSFFALPVIPELRVTPLGLYDVGKRQFL